MCPPNSPNSFPYGPPVSEAWRYGDAELDINTTYIQQGVLYKYGTSDAIYVCPGNRYTISRGGVKYPTTRSVSMVKHTPPAGKSIRPF